MNQPESRPPDAKKNDLEVVTYSALSTFRNCPKRFDYRYQMNIKSIYESDALFLGTLFHEAVQECNKFSTVTNRGSAAARAAGIKRINEKLDGHAGDPTKHRQWHLLTAMINGYCDRWIDRTVTIAGDDEFSDSAFETIATEVKFEADIKNPETGAKSRTFQLEGKVDEVLRHRSTGLIYIKETKTASQPDADYLNKLWTDYQILLYSRFAGQKIGMSIAGVLYDIVAKSRMAQKTGESTAEFEARKLDMKQPGRAKQQMPESDEEFAARLQEWYAQPDAYIRQILMFDAAQLEHVDEELWEQTQQILAARRRNRFSQNTSQCYAIGRPCDYVSICKNGCRFDESVQNLFRIVDPHEELQMQTNPVDVLSF